jgi:hypothetical protein
MWGDVIVALFVDLAAPRTEGEYDAKTHADFDGSGTRAGRHDLAGQRAKPVASSRLHPCAQSLNLTRQKGCM